MPPALNVIATRFKVGVLCIWHYFDWATDIAVLVEYYTSSQNAAFILSLVCLLVAHALSILFALGQYGKSPDLRKQLVLAVFFLGPASDAWEAGERAGLQYFEASKPGLATTHEEYQMTQKSIMMVFESMPELVIQAIALVSQLLLKSKTNPTQTQLMSLLASAVSVGIITSSM